MEKWGAILLFIIKGLIDSDSSATLCSIFFLHNFFSKRFGMCTQGRGYKSLLEVKWKQEFGVWGRAVWPSLSLGQDVMAPGHRTQAGVERDPSRGAQGCSCPQNPDTTHFCPENHLCDYWEKGDPDILGAKIPWPTKHQPTQKCLQNFLDTYLHVL